MKDEEDDSEFDSQDDDHYLGRCKYTTYGYGSGNVNDNNDEDSNYYYYLGSHILSLNFGYLV